MRPKHCPDMRPHPGHEWLERGIRWNCPGEDTPILLGVVATPVDKEMRDDVQT